MFDIFYIMIIILSNSVFFWSRVNDYKKKRWSLVVKFVGERGN